MTSTAQAIQTAVQQATTAPNLWTALWASLGAGVVTHLIAWVKSKLTPANEAAISADLQAAAPVVTAALAASGHPLAGQAIQAIAAVAAQQAVRP